MERKDFGEVSEERKMEGETDRERKKERDRVPWKRVNVMTRLKGEGRGTPP